MILDDEVENRTLVQRTASRASVRFGRTRIEAVLPASADGRHALFEAASFARMSAPMLPAILDADALTESRARCA